MEKVFEEREMDLFTGLQASLEITVEPLDLVAQTTEMRVTRSNHDGEVSGRKLDRYHHRGARYDDVFRDIAGAHVFGCAARDLEQRQILVRQRVRVKREVGNATLIDGAPVRVNEDQSLNRRKAIPQRAENGAQR